MGKKAIDIVLLPDEAMADRAIEANRALVEQCGEKIVLNKQSCLPHISLAMGCIEESDTARIEQILAEAAGKASSEELQVVGIQTSTNLAGEEVSVFEVEKTRALQSLHEEIMEKLAPYLSSDAGKEMLYDPAEVGQSTLLWIRNYREKSSFENFFPHITIGYGRIENGPFPIKFDAAKLALCHLGNHCTCRETLASIKVGPGEQWEREQ
ncbi:MAG: 2'-5' RNA ligase family protein [Planctomycetota bacterium]|jgi:2'-5' RNA ligase